MQKSTCLHLHTKKGPLPGKQTKILMSHPALHMFLSNQMLSRKGMFPPTKLSRFSSLIMVRRCVFGCSNARTLFCFPTTNWLRKKWLEFIHFEEEAICASSRLCDRHFSDEFFTNLGMVTAGITCYLTLADTAVPTLYTVGPSPPARVSIVFFRSFWGMTLASKCDHQALRLWHDLSLPALLSGVTTSWRKRVFWTGSFEPIL